MKFNYPDPSGVIRPDGTFRQLGYVGPEDTKNGRAITFDLQFRVATNGVIVNTLVSGEPIATTSSGLFHR